MLQRRIWDIRANCRVFTLPENYRMNQFSKGALSMIAVLLVAVTGVGLCWHAGRGESENQRILLSAPAVSKPRCECQRNPGLRDILFSDRSGQMGVRGNFSACKERIFPGCGIGRRHLQLEYKSARAKGLDWHLCRSVSHKHAGSHLPSLQRSCIQ